MDRRHFIKLASGLLVAAPVAIAVEPVRRFWQVSRHAPVGDLVPASYRGVDFLMEPQSEWWGNEPSYLSLDERAMLNRIKAEFRQAMEPFLDASSSVVVHCRGGNSRIVDIDFTVQLPGQIILDGFDHG